VDKVLGVCLRIPGRSPEALLAPPTLSGSMRSCPHQDKPALQRGRRADLIRQAQVRSQDRLSLTMIDHHQRTGSQLLVRKHGGDRVGDGVILQGGDVVLSIVLPQQARQGGGAASVTRLAIRSTASDLVTRP